MEVSALNHTALPGLRGPTPLLRLQSDERLIAMVRRGQPAAFEALVGRYESRLLSFCRHMLSSREDAEDVLQEVFAAAFNAILADQREINVRPWLYRIARNRSLNHLRRAVPIGVDSMDVHFADQGQSTGDKVFKRETFRQLIADVQQLPETQRTALLLREIDALSYEQIAEAMETTVPSVKSLLVRARISLAEAAEARKLSCQDVRLELAEVAEGLRKLSSPARRHVRDCERCHGFRRQLKENNRVMAAVFPAGVLLLVKKLVLTKIGSTASAGGAHVGGATVAGASAATAAGAGAGAGGVGAGAGLLTAGAGALATKAAAGLAAAALVTAGAVEVRQDATARTHRARSTVALASVAAKPFVPTVVRSLSQRLSATRAVLPTASARRGRPARAVRHAVTSPRTRLVAAVAPSPLAVPKLKAPRKVAAVTAPAPPPRPPAVQVQSDTTALPATPTRQPSPSTAGPTNTPMQPGASSSGPDPSPTPGQPGQGSPGSPAQPPSSSPDQPPPPAGTSPAGPGSAAPPAGGPPPAPVGP